MSDPRRLRDEPTSELLRSMIDAAREEEPSDGAVERALMAVGTPPIGADALTGTTEAHALAQNAAQLGAAGHGATAGLLLKWAGVGLVTGLVTAQIADGLPFAETTSPEPVIEAPRLEVPPPRPEPMPATIPVVPLPEPDEPAFVEPKPKAKTAPKTLAGRLAEEVEALDRARKSLAKGQPRQALVALDAYERRHRRGELFPEAMLLRAEALAELGEHKAAARVAERLIELQPNGPHATRARGLTRGVLR